MTAKTGKPEGEKVQRRFDPHRAAAILVDAIALGDQTTADKWQVSVKTIFRYRERMATDPVLSDTVREKVRAQSADWADVRLQFLRSTIAKLQALVALATVEHLHQVAGALKIVGDLHVVVNALGADEQQPVAHLPGPGAPADAPGEGAEPN